MSTVLAEFNRRFAVWSYTVSHKQLLLRSTKDHAHETRIDLLFKNVLYLALPTLIHDLTVSEADAATSSRIVAGVASDSPRSLDDKRVYVLRGRGPEGYVVASTVVHAEDTEDYLAPSSLIA